MDQRVLTRRVLRAASDRAARSDTPFYLFDPARLARDARAWRLAAAAADARVFYPYKCNRAAPARALLAREGLGAEVSNASDLELAFRAGLDGRRIVIHGPAKDRNLVDAGLERDCLFVTDGREDLEALMARSRSTGRPPRYLMRLDVRAAEPTQRGFGLPARELVAAAREALRARWRLWSGLAFHLGTGIASLAPYRRALAETASVARELARMGGAVEVLDVGGGFASPAESRLGSDGKPRGRGAPASAVVFPLAATARAALGPDVGLLLEPGRAIVSGSFHLVSRIVRVKRSARGTSVYVDASRAAHAYFVARGRHEMRALPARPGRSPSTVQLAGPLGVSLDVLHRKAGLGAPRPGDLVVIGAVGAYNGNAASAWAGPIPALEAIRR